MPGTIEIDGVVYGPAMVRYMALTEDRFRALTKALGLDGAMLCDDDQFEEMLSSVAREDHEHGNSDRFERSPVRAPNSPGASTKRR